MNASFKLIEILSEYPGWIKITDALGIYWAEDYHDWKIQNDKRLAEEWKKEKRKVTIKISEFKKENAEFEKECQQRYKDELKEKLEIETKKLEEMVEQRKSLLKKELQYKKVVKLDKLVNSQITRQEIENAENYPLGNIIEINNRGFANCVNHDDKNPSMYCKNNYAHCFSCGWTGNTIKVLMKKDNLNFKEAVIRLQ